jgi:hypothetical protein
LSTGLVYIIISSTNNYCACLFDSFNNTRATSDKHTLTRVK